MGTRNEIDVLPRKSIVNTFAPVLSGWGTSTFYQPVVVVARVVVVVGEVVVVVVYDTAITRLTALPPATVIFSVTWTGLSDAPAKKLEPSAVRVKLRVLFDDLSML